MRSDRFTSLIDASALAGALKRNIVLSLSEAGFFRPRWSKEILDETEKAIAQQIGDEAKAKVQRTRIEEAFPEGCVTGFHSLIAGLELPDPNDRHVLAAAIETRAYVLVTDNLKDFPEDVLAEYDIRPLSTDDFLADTIDLDPPTAIGALKSMRARFANPAITPDELILKIERQGMPNTASLILPLKSLL